MSIVLKDLEKTPQIPEDCYIDRSARLNGNIVMGSGCSVWFNVSIRGDVHAIRIGKRVNIQDNCIFHTSYQIHPLNIGDDTSFGHGVIAHGCTIGSRVLVGMGSIIMDAAEIGDDVLIGAGSLVTEGKKIPSGVLALGRPAKVVRDLKPEELREVGDRAAQYHAYMLAYKAQGKFTGWKDNPYGN